MYEIEKLVKEYIAAEQSFDPRLIMNKSGTELSLTEVGVFLKKMFNSGQMPGYTLKHYETTSGLVTVYYKYVTFTEQLKKWFNR